ncbi:hypothetical protein ACS127_16795 [Amphibacillus sp. Q70]|uniref:hypothetical protein n=1 Tax=Amphibacillus sp. Q70 TaxID=3453416 RepID=UPI003F8447E2
MYENRNSELEEALVNLHESIQVDKKRHEIVLNKINRTMKQSSDVKKTRMTTRLNFPIVISSFILLVIGVFLVDNIVFSPTQKESNQSLYESSEEVDSAILVNEDSAQQIELMEADDFLFAMPSYSPESNTKLQNIVYLENDHSITAFAQFYNQDQEIFSIHQEKAKTELSGDHLFDSINDEIIEVQDFDVYLSENDKMNKATLIVGRYSLQVSSHTLMGEELIQVIRSLPLEHLKKEN